VATATAIAQECGILPPPGAGWAEWYAAHRSAADMTRAGGGWFTTQDSDSSIVVAKPNEGGILASLGSLDTTSRDTPALLPAGGTAGAAGLSRQQAQHGLEEGDAGGLPEGAVMEGPEFRKRVLREDGSINAGGLRGWWSCSCERWKMGRGAFLTCTCIESVGVLQEGGSSSLGGHLERLQCGHSPQLES